MNRKQVEQSLLEPIKFWSKLTKEEVFHLLGSEVSAMVDYAQNNPHHCYDLFIHVLYTVDGIENTAPAFLRVAAFFHDIGKPVVVMKKQGRFVFYGHAAKSAEIAEPILEKLGYSTSEIEEICFYIAHHDDFISWCLPEEKKNKSLVSITNENLKKHIGKVSQKLKGSNFCPQKNNWEWLLQLCYADIAAQAEIIIQNNVIVDNKEHKLRKISAIMELLDSVF